jgi:hypothetical protein
MFEKNMIKEYFKEGLYIALEDSLNLIKHCNVTLDHLNHTEATMVRTKQSDPKRCLPRMGKSFATMKTRKSIRGEIKDSVSQLEEKHQGKSFATMKTRKSMRREKKDSDDQIKEKHQSLTESPAEVTIRPCVISLVRAAQLPCGSQLESRSRESENDLQTHQKGIGKDTKESFNIVCIVSFKRPIYAVRPNVYCVII